MSRAVSMLFLLVAGLECAHGSLMRSHRSSVKHAAHFRSALSRTSARTLSSSQIDQNTLQKAVKLWGKYDEDEDGMITAHELHTILSDEFHFTAPVIRRMVEGVEVSHSGHMNIDEYLQLFIKKKDSAQDEQNRAYFGIMDDNNDGSVDEAELAAGLEFTPAEARKLMRIWDANDSGVLDFDEFNAMMKSTQEKDSADAEEELAHNRVLFGAMDENNDGRVDVAQLAAGLEFTPAEARKLMRVWDADKNGALDFDEFNAMMKSVSRA